MGQLHRPVSPSRQGSIVEEEQGRRRGCETLAPEHRLLGGSTLRTGSPALDHPRKVLHIQERAIKATRINKKILAIDACRVTFLLFFFEGQSLVDRVAHVYQLVGGPIPCTYGQH